MRMRHFSRSAATRYSIAMAQREDTADNLRFHHPKYEAPEGKGLQSFKKIQNTFWLQQHSNNLILGVGGVTASCNAGVCPFQHEVTYT